MVPLETQQERESQTRHAPVDWLRESFQRTPTSFLEARELEKLDHVALVAQARELLAAFDLVPSDTKIVDALMRLERLPREICSYSKNRFKEIYGDEFFDMFIDQLLETMKKLGIDQPPKLLNPGRENEHLAGFLVKFNPVGAFDKNGNTYEVTRPTNLSGITMVFGFNEENYLKPSQTPEQWNMDYVKFKLSPEAFVKRVQKPQSK